MRLPLLCIISATCPHGVVTTFASTGSRHGRLRSSTVAAWEPMDLGLGEAGDLPLPGSTLQISDAPLVPGEGGTMIEDEMAALQQLPAARSPSPPPRLRSSATAKSGKHRKPVHLMSALAKAQAKGLMRGAEIESDSTDDVSDFIVSNNSTSRATKSAQTYTDEYDVVNEEDDEEDTSRKGKTDEASTKEDFDRQRSGDVEAVKQKAKKKKTLIHRAHQMAATQAKTVQSKVVVKAVAIADQPAGQSKMMGQCMAFASWVKGQGSVGPDFVRLWKGTCMPAVMAGTATPQYSNMCNALGAAVGRFALKPWAPPEVCQAVIQVFAEAGIGSTPLAG